MAKAKILKRPAATTSPASIARAQTGDRALRCGPRDGQKRVGVRQAYNRKKKEERVHKYLISGGLACAGTTSFASNLLANGLAITHERGNPSSPFKVHGVLDKFKKPDEHSMRKVCSELLASMTWASPRNASIVGNRQGHGNRT
jgi:hypothetical protein